jgi:hypothetical protein
MTAIFTRAGFFGEEPGRQELLASAGYLAIGGAVALGVPPVGLLLARVAGDRRAARRWSAAWAAGMVAAACLFLFSLRLLPGGTCGCDGPGPPASRPSAAGAADRGPTHGGPTPPAETSVRPGQRRAGTNISLPNAIAVGRHVER